MTMARHAAAAAETGPAANASRATSVAIQKAATTAIRRCQKRGATTGNAAIDASIPTNGSPLTRAGALDCMPLTLQVTSNAHNGIQSAWI